MDTHDAEARRKLAFDLYAQGASHEQIAEDIDRRFRHTLPRRYTARDVSADLTAQYGEVQDMEGLSRESRRTLMGRRFQMLIDEMMKVVQSGNHETKIKAVSTLIRLFDREAALYGLDEPKKTISVAFDARAEAERLAKELGMTKDEEVALWMEIEDMLRESSGHVG